MPAANSEVIPQELNELLWFAAEHGELDLAKQALVDGANVSSINSEFYNQTALHCAAQFGAGYVLTSAPTDCLCAMHQAVLTRK